MKQVGRRLIDCVRESDTVSRLGGDEFVVLLADTSTPDDAQIVAAKVLAALGKPFQLHGREAWIGVSIGIAVSSQGDTDADALLRSADQAMYTVKHAGRNNFAVAARTENGA